jgi:hypothetical protein
VVLSSMFLYLGNSRDGDAGFGRCSGYCWTENGPDSTYPRCIILEMYDASGIVHIVQKVSMLPVDGI